MNQIKNKRNILLEKLSIISGIALGSLILSFIFQDVNIFYSGIIVASIVNIISMTFDRGDIS